MTKTNVHHWGKLRGDKVRFKDGVGCCIWYPMGDDEDTGMCFDIDGDDLDDAINLLIDLREAEADVYEED